MVETPARQRIDKWLFFARIAKSRTLAQEWVEGGHVSVNGEKVRRASADVRVGDRLEVLAERRDSVEHAVLLLLQTLTPNQRAAYVLREAFGYSYAQIGDLLHLSVGNARQQVSRAQDRLNNRRHRQHVDAATHRRLVQAIFTAARTGDLGRLEDVLTGQEAPYSGEGTAAGDSASSYRAAA